MANVISGIVERDGSPVAATLYLLDQASGALVEKVDSSAVDGSYTFGIYAVPLTPLNAYLVLCDYGVDVRPLAHGPVTPVSSGGTVYIDHPLVNPGFEAAALADGGATSNGTDGWTRVGEYSGAFNPTLADFAVDNPLAAPAAGTHAGYANLNGALRQDPPVVLSAGRHYTIKAAIGWRQGHVEQPNYEVELRTLSGDVLLADTTTTGGTHPTPVRNGWIGATVEYSVAAQYAGETVRIVLKTTSGTQASFDEISLVSFN